MIDFLTRFKYNESTFQYEKIVTDKQTISIALNHQ